METALPTTQNVRYCTCPGHVGEVELPATSEFFRVHNRNGVSRVESWCRVCEGRRDRQRQKEAGDAAKELLSVNLLRKSGKRVPHFDELLESTYHKIGGFNRLAKILANFIKDKKDENGNVIPKTGIERQQQERVSMALFKATQEASQSKDNLKAMKDRTTAEIRAQLSQVLKMAGIKSDELDDMLDAVMGEKPVVNAEFTAITAEESDGCEQASEDSGAT